MTHLYLDENVDVLLAKLLHARGIKVTTTLEANNLRTSDESQLEYASSISPALATHNRGDFQKLYTEYIQQSKPFSGIIIVEYRNVYEVAQRLITLVSHHSDLSNKLLRV
jgi:hypothetical protein